MAAFIQTQVVNAGDPAAEIQKLEPPFLGYRKLLALLPVYEGYANQAEGEKLPTVTKTVRPGQPYAGVVRLGRFLQIIGDIPAGVQLDPNATIYDGALIEGVKHYQDRHGKLPPATSTRTINELNTPPAVRIRQIKLTLERWRWLPHSFAQPPVVVNLPEYRARAINGWQRRLLQKRHHRKSLRPQVSDLRERDPIRGVPALSGRDSQHSAERNRATHPEGPELHRQA